MGDFGGKLIDKMTYVWSRVEIGGFDSDKMTYVWRRVEKGGFGVNLALV